MNEESDIVEITINDITYRTWTIRLIKPLILKFLKEKIDDILLIPEINRIDIIIINKKTYEIIPVEMQKSVTRIGGFSHAKFEDYIRRQLEDNIENYGKCWFFFDSEYLRSIQNGNVGKSTSVDLTWLVKLMKENTLKVFAIKYDGTVRELTTKDFDFLKDVSQSCEIGYDNDERVLNRNKLKIFANIMIGYNFTQEEIDKFYNEFNNNNDKKQRCTPFFIKSNNERCKLYGIILRSIWELEIINNILDMNIKDNNTNYRNTKQDLSIIKIFEVIGTHGRGNLVRFVDKFDICKYFPGYIRNKVQWDGYKGNNLTYSTFTMIVNGSLKQHKTMIDY